MGGDSGATAIVSVPKIDSGLEKAVVLEMFIMVQIRVKYNSFFRLRNCVVRRDHILPSI